MIPPNSPTSTSAISTSGEKDLRTRSSPGSERRIRSIGASSATSPTRPVSGRWSARGHQDGRSRHRTFSSERSIILVDKLAPEASPTRWI